MVLFLFSIPLVVLADILIVSVLTRPTKNPSGSVGSTVDEGLINSCSNYKLEPIEIEVSEFTFKINEYYKSIFGADRIKFEGN